jgi:hypothetical protein
VGTTRAVWDPWWYGDDQSIAVRLTKEFIFREPESTRPFRGRALVFYNGWSDGDAVVGRGTISRIWHPEYGQIREIDTGGDNYRVYLANGTVFDVDPEENPGSVSDAWAFDADGKAEPRRAFRVQRWRVEVEFEALSDLRAVDSESWQAARRPGERRMTIVELSQRHGVAIYPLVDAAVVLGLGAATSEPLSAEDVYVIEARLGLARP